MKERLKARMRYVLLTAFFLYVVVQDMCKTPPVMNVFAVIGVAYFGFRLLEPDRTQKKDDESEEN